jgi:hypothetical protein
LAVQRQLAEDDHLVEPLAEKRALAAQDGKRHRQIKCRAFLADVGGRQVDGDALEWEIVAAILERGLDALAAFLHGDVGKADHVEIARFARTDVHLHLHEVGVDAENGGAEGFEVHRPREADGFRGRQSNAFGTFMPI